MNVCKDYWSHIDLANCKAKFQYVLTNFITLRSLLWWGYTFIPTSGTTLITFRNIWCKTYRKFSVSPTGCFREHKRIENFIHYICIPCPRKTELTQINMKLLMLPYQKLSAINLKIIYGFSIFNLFGSYRQICKL